MVNLLNETIETIKDNGLCIDDIVFIGSRISLHQCTWDEFKILADNNYNDGFGWQEVAFDLEIVFKGGAILFRHEYDGSEGWGSEKNKEVDFTRIRMVKFR